MLAAAVGIQPNHVAAAQAGDWETVCRLALRPEVAAIGETGLDRHWAYTPMAQQEDYFGRHLELARQLGKPVVIHCREAEADVLRLLRADYDKHGAVRGVMHSFTGDRAAAEACLEMGLFLSFAGMITYKNAQALRELAGRVPLDRLLVETDSPYLAPAPVRGTRNEPAYIVHTARQLAEIKSVAAARLAEKTAENARKLFGFAQELPVEAKA
jgi:TatD DNase family protein